MSHFKEKCTHMLDSPLTEMHAVSVFYVIIET